MQCRMPQSSPEISRTPPLRPTAMPKTNLRTEYTRATLEESGAGADPVELFQRWFDEAVRAGGREPNAMSLATCGADGQPNLRIVLCKEFDREGFVFYTNYLSSKGRELAQNPLACLLFYWAELERQVRISGPVSRVSASESDAYFSQRPLAARIGAWASPQSEAIAGREDLEQRMAEAERRFAGSASPQRPPHWGGYRLRPTAFEFWQGRPSRLHDRLRYWRASGEPAAEAAGWRRERLAP
jgi:pyridoxamine 5'-phosphate oxidase